MYLQFVIIPIFFAVIFTYVDFSMLQSVFSKLIKPNPYPEKNQDNLITSDELKLYNGIDRPQLYLAILGKIFDVSKGASHYGPGKSYNFFIGRDGSRSFVTGQFNDHEASDQVADLTFEELSSLNHWVQFYNKEYKRVGKLIGRYYQMNGKLTQYGKEVKKMIKAADKKQKDEDLEKLKYPSCNVEWDVVRGSRVWCSNKSGGVERHWVGVPRQLYEPGSPDYRCVCVNAEHEHITNLKQYEGCDSRSASCFIKS